jgi:hypothetical protein
MSRRDGSANCGRNLAISASPQLPTMLDPDEFWNGLEAAAIYPLKHGPMSASLPVARHGKLPPRRHEELPPPWIAEERANESGTNHGMLVVE